MSESSFSCSSRSLSRFFSGSAIVLISKEMWYGVKLSKVGRQRSYCQVICLRPSKDFGARDNELFQFSYLKTSNLMHTSNTLIS